MPDLERIQEDGFMAFIQGKTSHEYPSFRGSRVQQLRQMKAWIRGWRNALKRPNATCWNFGRITIHQKGQKHED